MRAAIESLVEVEYDFVRAITALQNLRDALAAVADENTLLAWAFGQVGTMAAELEDTMSAADEIITARIPAGDRVMST